MDTRRLDIGSVIRYAWETTKANLGLLIGITIVAGLVSGLPSWIAKPLQRSSPGLAFLLGLVGFALSTLVSIGAARISLRVHDGQPAAVRDLFTADWSLFWRFLAATIVYSLIVAVGLILLVVPGIIFGVRYVFYGYFVLERGSRPVEALAQSASATEGARWDVFLLGLALLLVNMLGALLFGLGLLITLPMSYLAAARTYRTLTGGAGSGTGDLRPDGPAL